MADKNGDVVGLLSVMGGLWAVVTGWFFVLIGKKVSKDVYEEHKENLKLERENYREDLREIKCTIKKIWEKMDGKQNKNTPRQPQ